MSSFVGSRSSIAEREGNYNCYDRSSIAERERRRERERERNQKKNAITTTTPVLQRDRNCNYYDRASIDETEREKERKKTATTATLPAWQRKKRRTLRGTPNSQVSETADLEDLRCYAFLNKILCCGSKESIHLDGVLTEAVLPNYKPPSIINLPSQEKESNL